MNTDSVRGRFQHGFTLLEVLVAFSITALSMGVLFQIYARGSTAALLGKEYAMATTIAESKLVGLGILESLDESELDGIEYDKYTWEIEILDYSNEELMPVETGMQLKEVELRVEWSSKGKQRKINLHTLKPVFLQ